MKKFVKKTILMWAVVIAMTIICSGVLLAAYVPHGGISAYAEGEQEEKTYVITESDLTEFLLSLSKEEEWQETIKSELIQNIISFTFALIASIFGLLLVSRSLKNNNLQLKAQIKRCADGDESVVKTTNELIEAKKDLKKMATDLNEKMNFFSERQNELENEIQSMSKRYINKEEKIVQMLQVAFCNDPDLVKNGYAKIIKEISEEARDEEGTESKEG